MIIFKQGDIFDCDVEAIVNTVNCVGAMGRGIALQFKKKYPENAKFYETSCKHKMVMPGKMLVYEQHGLLNPKFIINFPTKRHWRGESRLDDISNGLDDLLEVIKRHNIASIALPPLGCGLGGLNWNDVKLLMEKAFFQLTNVHVFLFEPTGTPSAKDMVRNRKIPKMTPGRAALVGLMQIYLQGLMDPFITLLEIHKLMYFLQEIGEPLRLRYAKAPYGPYAENLLHVLNDIEGHMISGYADGGNNPAKQIELVPGAIEDAAVYLEGQVETSNRIKKVSQLIEGFETSYGMELLATVHWVMTREKAETMEDIIENVYRWGQQKQIFSKRQIEIAAKHLTDKLQMKEQN